MAFKDVLLKQRKSGSGVLSSLGSAAYKTTLEKIDPRNYLFTKGSFLKSLFPNVKGYSAIGDKEKISKPEPISSPVSSTDGVLIAQKLDVIGKNTMVLPIMMRDMNVMRQGIVKLVRLQGGTVRDKADKFFQSAKERESLYESQFKKTTSPTKVGETPKKEGGFGLLQALAIPLLYGIGKYFTSPEFRKSVNEMVDKLMKSLFGDDYKEKIKNVLMDVVKNVAIGLGVVATAFAAFKLAVSGITSVLLFAAKKIAGAFGLPGGTSAGGKGGKNGKGKLPGKGRLGMLASILSALGLGYLAYEYLSEDGEQPTTVPGEPGAPGTEPGAIPEVVKDVGAAVAVAGGAYAASSILKPKLDERVASRTGGKTTFDEKTGRYRKDGKFTKAEEEKLGKSLKKLQEWFIKCSKKPGFLSLMYRRVLSKFGIGIALKISAFITGLVAAPFSAGLSTLISIAMLALNVYMIYEIYDWLFGEENAADEIEKELDILEKLKSETATPIKTAADFQRLDKDTTPVPTPKEPTATPSNAPTPTSGVSLEQIGQAESGKMGYDAANKGKAGDMPNGMPGLSTKTIGEVMKLQSEKKLFAAGKYQIIPETLKGLVNKGVAKESDIFDKETQDKLAKSLYDTAIAKAGSDPIKQQYELSKVWAAINNPYTGVSYYAGIGNNKASIGTLVAQAPPSNGKVSGSTIAGTSVALSDSRMQVATAPVVINAPTTNNMQGQQNNPFTMGGGIPQTVDEEFMKILVGRTTV